MSRQVVALVALGVASTVAVFAGVVAFIPGMPYVIVLIGGTFGPTGLVGLYLVFLEAKEFREQSCGSSMG